MVKNAMVCFLLAGFLLAPLAAEAKLRDETVVLYLPFDEGKGEEVKDLSKSGKTGVLGTRGKDLPQWVDGKFGKALEFDGETNFVQIEETPDFSFASDPGTMTLAAWVEVLKTNTDNHTQNRQPIIMTRNVFIGHREDGQFLNAVIDDVRIWNRVLEPDEIVETMESPLTGLAVHPNSRLASKWGG